MEIGKILGKINICLTRSDPMTLVRSSDYLFSQEWPKLALRANWEKDFLPKIRKFDTKIQNCRCYPD